MKIVYKTQAEVNEAHVLSKQLHAEFEAAIKAQDYATSERLRQSVDAMYVAAQQFTLRRDGYKSYGCKVWEDPSA